MNKPLIMAVVSFVFFIAAYNIYNSFSSSQPKPLTQEELEAKEEKKRLAQLEKENIRKAKILEETERLNKKEQAIEDAKLERKIYVDNYNAQAKMEKEQRALVEKQEYLNRRILKARELVVGERLPQTLIEQIERSTYLYIRNNPNDFKGDYNGRAGEHLIKGGEKSGENGLMLFAIYSTNIKAIQEIINIGHDVNTVSKSGVTPLMFASAYNTSEVVNFLLEKGAKKDPVEYLTEGNALHIASRYNPKPSVIEALVKAGFDLEQKDKDGNTPLLIATKFNQNMEIVEKLIELGANTEATDGQGDVAWSYAKQRVKGKLGVKGFRGGGYVEISEEYQDKVIGMLEI